MSRYFTRVYGGIAPGYLERVLAKNKAADETNPNIIAIIASSAYGPLSSTRTSTMVNSAIKILDQRGGSSDRAIKKWISSTYKLDMKKLNPNINKYLKTAVESGVLIQIKGKGARGTFKLPIASTSRAESTSATPKTKSNSPKKRKSIEMKSSLDKETPSKKTTTATITAKTPVSTRSKKSSCDVKPSKGSVETRRANFKKIIAAKSTTTKTPRLTRSKTSPGEIKLTKSVETRANFNKSIAATKSTTETPILVTRSKKYSSEIKPTKSSVDTKTNKKTITAKSTTKTSVKIERRRSPRIINATKISPKEMGSSSKEVIRPERATRNTPVKRAPFRQR